jgi:vacuolar-type H+-ATPase subunit D/Vma8
MSKITEEQLKQLQEQEGKKNAIKHDIGLLETQKHALLHAFANIQEEQDKLKVQLEEEYGKINVNLQDGTYEVIPEEVEEAE